MTLSERLSEGRALVASRPAPRDGAIRCAGATHPGLIRDRNEDRLHVDAERGILIVVDGMGGQAAGETAAETALALLRSRLERQTGRVEERVREAIALANNEIVRLAAQNPAFGGMGCVLTLAVIEDGMVTVGHVGDSRAYRLGADGIVKVTRDHSPIGMREDEGELSETDAMRHPRRNEVYRSLGAEEHTPLDEEFVEVSRFPFDPEGAILVCSDGLTDMVSSETIARIVRENGGHEQRAVDRLIAAANLAGGKDNVTVAIAAGERFASALSAPREWRGIERRAGWRERREREAPGHGSAFTVGLFTGVALLAVLLLLDRHPPRGVAGQAFGVLRPALQALLPAAEGTHGPRTLGVGHGLEYDSIRDALAAARPGDTVAVAPGTYHEQVRLKEGVTLWSRVPRQAVLAPEGEAAVRAMVVAEGLSAASLVGFRIAPLDSFPMDVGVRVADARITIDDVEIAGARVAGVAYEGRSEGALRGSFVHRNPGAGVTIAARSTPRLSGNMILDNGRGPRRARAGVEMESTGELVMVGNVIAGNAAEGVRGAPAAMRANLLENNVFEAFGRANVAGPVAVR